MDSDALLLYMTILMEKLVAATCGEEWVAQAREEVDDILEVKRNEK